MTLDLYVSRPGGLPCDEVLAVMRRLGISGNVTANRSLVPADDDELRLEDGCRVRVAGRDEPRDAVRRLWLPLRNRFGLECAYVDAAPAFRGCVLDYLRPSSCSGCP